MGIMCENVLGQTEQTNQARQTERTYYEKKPFTVSAVFYDGSGKFISHCFASDARAARDDVLMQTGGAAFIVSVFEGHLVEADKKVFPIGENSKQTETVGNVQELPNLDLHNEEQF